MSDAYIGYEVTGYTDGSVITSGYVYLNLSSDYTEQQVQAVLVQNAALYENYGLNVDPKLIIVSGQFQCTETACI